MMMAIMIALVIGSTVIVARMAIVIKDQRDELEYLYEVIRQEEIGC